MSLTLALTANALCFPCCRGVNNDFLVRSSDPLALLYNDMSPLVSSQHAQQA